MPKEHRFTIRLDDADNDWLAEQEEELGIDKVSITCMMIRRHRKAGLPAVQSAPVHYEPQIVETTRPRFVYGEITKDDLKRDQALADRWAPLVPTESHPEEFSGDEGAEAAIEDIVSARLSEAKITPVVTVNEFGGPTGNVRPLSHNKRPAGKGWMK